MIRKWFVEQAVSNDQAVAALVMSITADGGITTSGIGLEPEITPFLVEELSRLNVKMQARQPKRSATVHKIHCA